MQIFGSEYMAQLVIYPDSKGTVIILKYTHINQIEIIIGQTGRGFCIIVLCLLAKRHIMYIFIDI